MDDCYILRGIKKAVLIGVHFILQLIDEPTLYSMSTCGGTDGATSHPQLSFITPPCTAEVDTIAGTGGQLGKGAVGADAAAAMPR
jgi:hypothetical protein